MRTPAHKANGIESAETVSHHQRIIPDGLVTVRGANDCSYIERAQGEEHEVRRWVAPLLAVAIVLALWELLVRAGLLSETSFPTMTDTFGRLLRGARLRRVLDGGRRHAAGLGARPRHRDPAGRARGHPRRLQRAAVPRAARADRVPAPDPVRGADPAGRARLRHRPAEQGLPGGVRLVLAAVRADASTGSRTSTRSLNDTAQARSAWAASSGCGGSRLPSAVPYIATGVRISSAVALILSVTAELVIGAAGLGRRSASRRPAARSTSCTR